MAIGQNRAQDLFIFVQQRGEVGATFDEAAVALGVSHQSGAARWSELVHWGCFVEIGKRRTEKGKKAGVFVIAEGASFSMYRGSAKKASGERLTPTEKALLDAARGFLEEWFTEPVQKRPDAINKVIHELVRIGRTQYKIIPGPKPAQKTENPDAHTEDPRGT